MQLAALDTQDQVQGALDLFPAFDVFSHPYKYVNEQPIEAYVLVPKDLGPGKRPLLVRLHVGAFCEGQCDIWLRPWILELALKHGAILVTPDYRLVPESTIEEAIGDLQSFWHWAENELPALLRQPVVAGAMGPGREGIELDSANAAVVGESAGGYYSAQSALLAMTTRPLGAMLLQYPALALRKHLAAHQAIPEADKVPVAILEDHLAAATATATATATAAAEPCGDANKKMRIVTRTRNGTRMHLASAMFQHGRSLIVDDNNEALVDPIVSLEEAARGDHLPPTLLFHARGDPAVAAEDSETWAEKLRGLRPDVPLKLVVREDEVDHVFDKWDTLATPWLAECIQFVEGYWPVQATEE
ncbi:Alpha/Beta hydrolase protein [Xylariomycetidae sp. FL2044]|nr:Alpha/Beta hydrolase protein [Xylariomycetidae sp. FL2044]